jgi:hypothetical protein
VHWPLDYIRRLLRDDLDHNGVSMHPERLSLQVQVFAELRFLLHYRDV